MTAPCELSGFVDILVSVSNPAPMTSTVARVFWEITHKAISPSSFVVPWVKWSYVMLGRPPYVKLLSCQMSSERLTPFPFIKLR
jgi:hypothetical protein